MNKEIYERLKLLMGYVKRNNHNSNMIFADETENPNEYTLGDTIIKIDSWIDEVAKEYNE